MCDGLVGTVEHPNKNSEKTTLYLAIHLVRGKRFFVHLSPDFSFEVQPHIVHHHLSHSVPGKGSYTGVGIL